jgi:hypothetical protein
MSRKKHSLIIFLFVLNVIIPGHIFSNPIQGASYVVTDFTNSPVIEVYFYTFDGELITTQRHNNHRPSISLLDPDAPKPQPVDYEITETIHPKDSWLTITFYDKNNNKIATYPYNKYPNHIIVTNARGIIHSFNFDEANPQNINKDFPLDLNKVRLRSGICLLL